MGREEAGVASSFRCAICGEEHEGLPTDRGYALPDDVWAIPESERARHGYSSGDICDIDGRCFLRGVLEIPLMDRDDHFGWGVWVEAERAVLERYAAIWSEDARTEPPRVGVLANVVPGFEDAANEQLTIHFGNASNRPTFTTSAESRSSLAVAQRRGLDDAAYHAMLVRAGAI